MAWPSSRAARRHNGLRDQRGRRGSAKRLDSRNCAWRGLLPAGPSKTVARDIMTFSISTAQEHRGRQDISAPTITTPFRWRRNGTFVWRATTADSAFPARHHRREAWLAHRGTAKAERLVILAAKRFEPNKIPRRAGETDRAARHGR